MFLFLFLFCFCFCFCFVFVFLQKQKLQSCFIYILSVWPEDPLIEDVSGVYSALLLNTDLLKIALRAQKACGAFGKSALGREHFAVFLCKTCPLNLLSKCVSPSRCRGTSELLGKPTNLRVRHLR